MRITNLYKLEEYATTRKLIGNSILLDIISLATSKYSDDKHKEFMIQVRLVTVEKYEPYH